jgi:hypothetical protein
LSLRNFEANGTRSSNMIDIKGSNPSTPWLVSRAPAVGDPASFYVTTLDGRSIADCGPAGETNAKHIVRCVTAIRLIDSVLKNTHDWNADTLDNIAEVLRALEFAV